MSVRLGTVNGPLAIQYNPTAGRDGNGARVGELLLSISAIIPYRADRNSGSTGQNRLFFTSDSPPIPGPSGEILDKQDKVDLVDTTFPAGRNEALQWNIKSQIAGKIPVEIRYLTSGITWAADYVGVANEDETKLNVTG